MNAGDLMRVTADEIRAEAQNPGNGWSPDFAAGMAWAAVIVDTRAQDDRHDSIRSYARVPGHTLVAEGRPRLVDGCCGTESTHGHANRYDKIGHGRCSCGEFGPCDTTTMARQQWHREHKRQVAASDSSQPSTA